MPYQSWYSAATSAAVDMNMPPALVPAINSAMQPPRQPMTPINANVPNTNNIATEGGNDQPNNSFSQNNLSGNDQSNSSFARNNLRTAGRFDKETAMITPQETQRMMFGDQAFRNTRRISEERDKTKDYSGANTDPQTRTQEDMMGDMTGQEMFLGVNTSNPFSDQFSNLYNIL